MRKLLSTSSALNLVPGNRQLLPRWTRWLPLMTCLLWVPACTSVTGSSPGESTTDEGTRLEPLPEPPVIQIEQDDAPGASKNLEVVVARPTGEVGGDVRPTLTFNRPVISLDMVENLNKLPPPATIEPAIPGTWRWIGASSVEFVPSGLIPYATDFKVTVQAGLKALDGTSLHSDFTYTFNTPRPGVLVTPSAGYRWIAPDQIFQLNATQPLKDLATKAYLSLEGGKTRVALEVVKTVDLAEEARAKRKTSSTRMSDEERGFKDRRTRYDVRPVTKLPLNMPVTLVLASDLAGTEGKLTLGQESRTDFRTYGPLKFTAASGCLFDQWTMEQCPDQHCPCVYGPLILSTTNPVKLETLKERLTIQPAVTVDWENSAIPEEWESSERGPYVAIRANFVPGTRYKIRVAAGVKDEFDQAASAFMGEFFTDNAAPSLEVDSTIALIESSGDGALPVSAVNLKTINADVWSLTPADMARALNAREYVPPHPATRLTVDAVSSRNQPRWFPLDLRSISKQPKKTGLFMTNLYSPEMPAGYRVGPVLAQVTDLAVHAKIGASQGVAWVTRMSTGKPEAGVKIELYDSVGTKRWTGSTGKDGALILPGVAGVFGAAYDWTTPFVMISATKDTDTSVTLSTWDGSFWPGSMGVETDSLTDKPSSLGFVLADRGIYRPGDEVHVKGVMRYRRLGDLMAPAAGQKVTVKVVDARDQKVLTQEVNLTRYGTWTHTFSLSKDSPLGWYRVEVTAKADKGEELNYFESFRVEEYRAPQFTVDVTAPQESVMAGSSLQADVMARYLFGGAMSGATVHWTVARESTDFAPPKHEGFDFGLQAWWWDDSDPLPSYEVFASGEGDVDAQGMYRIEPGVADAPGARPWEYTLEADVEDVSRLRFADRVTVRVHPADAYVGVKLAGDGFAKVGSPATLELVAVNPEGERQVGRKLSAEIKLREWKNIRKREAGNQWVTVSEVQETKAGSCEVVSQTAVAPCAFTPTKPGFYLVEATLVDGQGRKQITRSSFYVVGDGWVSWQREDNGQIELVPDKELYEAGETAKVLIKNPYPESQALITLEREGVIKHELRVLKGAAETIEVPLDDSMLPNVYVSVVIARGRVPNDQGMESGDDPGRPAVRVGYTTLKLEKRSRRLNVALTTDAPDYRPRGKVTVNLKVTDFQGKGARSEVTLWAVDEGVLRLTDYTLPDPVEILHPSRGLRVRVAESLIHLVQRRNFANQDKGFSTGGSGGMDGTGADMRSQFKTTPIFLPEVETDENGMATVDFTLPDNLTTFRLMAVAVNGIERFGTAENKITVSKPLLVMQALPRLTRVGDVFEAGVVVTTKQSDPIGKNIDQVIVNASAQGLQLEGKPQRTIRMNDGKAKEVRFTFKALQAGVATLRFTVEGGGVKDGLELKLPVQVPVSMEAVAVYGETKDKAVEGIVPPSGVMAGVGGLELGLSSTVLAGFDEGMRQLIDYPFGCLEQLSSRLVPFVALRELFGKFGVKYPTEQMAKREREAFINGWLGEDTLKGAGNGDPDVVVTKTIQKIQALQTWEGGYKYWSSSLCPSDYGSAYAVLALGRAKELGYPVDADAFKKGQEWLAETVAAGQKISCSFGSAASDDVTRVFALYTLARTGAPKPSTYAELYGRRAALPLFAKAMLADAMYVGKGDRKQASALLKEILNNAQETAGEVHFTEKSDKTGAAWWSSDTRTSALVLQTLASLQPDHPYVLKIARHLALVRGKNGRFRNTQEAAFSLMALADVVRTKEKEAPAFEARVLLGEQTLTQASFQGRSMGFERKKLPIDALTPAGTTPTMGNEVSHATPPQSRSLTFVKEGKGNLYYSALLRYAPVELPTTPLDQGMIVQRWFEPFAGGGQSKSFEAGELVRIRVRVASPAERHFVAVEVPLPSGLEPVDTSLASTASLSRSMANEGMGMEYEGEGEGEEDGESMDSMWNYGFYSPFNHTEQRDDRVILFSDDLPPGVHVTSFTARATTPGDFVLKPARAEEMYTPEVFGRSDGGRFKIRPGKNIAKK